MSHRGIIAAKQYADDLPVFDNFEVAHECLMSAQRETLNALLQEHGVELNLDFSVESLKRLEKWFLESGSPEAGCNGYSIPHAIGFYFGEILCRRSGFGWVVEEFPFQRGRFEIGVKRPLLTIMLTKGKRPGIAGNKRMQSLWRECSGYAP